VRVTACFVGPLKPGAAHGVRRHSPEVPIVLASGVMTSDRISDAVSMGLNGFLPKPYTGLALRTALRDALSGEVGRVEETPPSRARRVIRARAGISPVAVWFD
jgi:DNA-binding NarL/FixJ family response regulator